MLRILLAACFGCLTLFSFGCSAFAPAPVPTQPPTAVPVTPTKKIPPTETPVPTPTPVPVPPPKPLKMKSPEYGAQAFLWWRPETADRDLGLMKAAGLTWVKQQFAWRDIEGASPSTYVWLLVADQVRRRAQTTRPAEPAAPSAPGGLP